MTYRVRTPFHPLSEVADMPDLTTLLVFLTGAGGSALSALVTGPLF